MVARAEVGRAPGNDDRGQRRRPAGKTMIAVQGEVLVVKVAWEADRQRAAERKSANVDHLLGNCVVGLSVVRLLNPLAFP